MNVGGARGYRGHLGIKNHLTTMHKSANEHYMLSKYLSTVRLNQIKMCNTFFPQKQKLLQISTYSLSKYQQCNWQNNEQIQTQ